MPGKIDAYNLGDLGVDLVSSPLHSDDGTLLLAQNVIVEPVGGQHAIAKRPGHTKITPTAAAGALFGICPIPFADPSNFWIAGTVVFHRDSANKIEYSTDGINWQTGVGFVAAASDQTSYLSVNGAGRLYFGTISLAVNYVSGNPPAITALAGIAAGGIVGIHAAAADEIYVTTADQLVHLCPGDATSEVICNDPWDGDGVPGRIFKFDGTVYLGSITTGNSGKIYRYEGGLTWAEDAAFNVDLSVSSFAIFHGELYASMYVSGTPDPATDKIVRRRSGVWAGVHDATGDFHSLYAFNEQLFAARETGTATEIWVSSDGESWTLDEDLTASFGVTPGLVHMVAWNSALYVQCASDSVFRRTTAGAWTELTVTAPLGVMMGAY